MHASGETTRTIVRRDSVGPWKWVAIAGALLAGMAGNAGAEELHVPEVRLPLMARAPQIDGRVEEPEWVAAVRMQGFGRGPKLAPLEAAFWLGCDGKELFLAVVSETPPGGQLLARFVPLPQDGDARTWLDDSIEMVLDPLRHDPARRRLYHANINAKGAINDTAYKLGGGGEAWRGNWRIANQIVGDRWHFEAALPLADMGVTEADLARPWGVRLCRNWQQTKLARQTEWSPLGGPYLTPETMPVVTWEAAAPVVQTVQLADPDTGKPHVKVTVLNPGSQPVAVKTLLRVVPQSSLPQEVSRVLTLAAGETGSIELAASALNEDLVTLIRVTSADERTTFYVREFVWRGAAEREMGSRCRGLAPGADPIRVLSIVSQGAFSARRQRPGEPRPNDWGEAGSPAPRGRNGDRRDRVARAPAVSVACTVGRAPAGRRRVRSRPDARRTDARSNRAAVCAARVSVGGQPAWQVGRAGRTVHGDPCRGAGAEHRSAPAYIERTRTVGPGGVRLVGAARSRTR